MFGKNKHLFEVSVSNDFIKICLQFFGSISWLFSLENTILNVNLNLNPCVSMYMYIKIREWSDRHL